MKKLFISLLSLVAVFALVGCNLQSGDTIKFTSLPQPVYTQGHKVEKFMNDIKISVNDGAEMSLAQAEGLSNVVISGIELDEPGEHVLVVVYNNVSLTYKYQVVASNAVTKVSTLSELTAALNAQDKVIELISDLKGLTDKVEINYALTIYGNGHTIEVVSGDRAVNVNGVKEGTVAFYDLNIRLTSGAYASRGLNFAQCEDIEVIIDNTSVYNKLYYAINITGSVKDITLTVKNGSTAGGYCAINCWATDSTINVYDSTLNGDNVHGKGDDNNFAVVVISSNSATNGKNNSMIFDNVTLNATSQDGNIENILIIQGRDGNIASGNSVKFNNCTFNKAVYDGVEHDFMFIVSTGESLPEVLINGESIK